MPSTLSLRSAQRSLRLLLASAMLLLIAWAPTHADEALILFDATQPASGAKAGRLHQASGGHAVPLQITSDVLRSALESDRLALTLPDGREHVLAAVSAEVYFDRYRLIRAHFEDVERNAGSALFAICGDALFAELDLPDGHYSVVSDPNATWLLPPAAFRAGAVSALPMDFEAIDLLTYVPREPIGRPSSFASAPTVLNLALVLTAPFGTSESHACSMLMQMAVANQNFADSGVDLELHPALITRLRPEREAELASLSNTESIGYVASFINDEQEEIGDLIDLEYAGLLVDSPGSALQIHQFSFAVGAGNSCGFASAAAGGLGNISFVRPLPVQCPGATTLAHEIGHNITLTHQDGARKSPDDLPPEKMAAADETDSWTREWFSIMFPGPRSDVTRRYFTGGLSQSVIDPNTCFGFDSDPISGICNASPYPNSISRLNARRDSAASIVRSVELPSTTTIVPRIGLWHNANRSGHGIDIQQAPNGSYFVLWFTYTATGTPTWYVSETGSLDGDTWTQPLFRAIWNGSSAQLIHVGQVNLQFTDATNATFAWTLDGQSGSEPFTFLFGGSGRTGAWFAPSEPGWGLHVEEESGVLIVVTTFYLNSEPRWVWGQTTASDDVVMPVLWFEGPSLCPACSGSASPTSQPAGTIRLQIASGTATSGTVWTSITTPQGDWIRSGIPISLLTQP